MSDAQEIKLARVAKAYESVFQNSEQGQIVLRDLIQNHYFLSPTTENGCREGDIAFREGQRHVILMIMDKLGFANDPNRFINIMREISNDNLSGDIGNPTEP